MIGDLKREHPYNRREYALKILTKGGLMTTHPPKVFISYSWTTQEHVQWVIELATDLRNSGVDAILDKWDLKEGHDALAFMERMIKDPEIRKVVLVCDRMYREKADGRCGGVGAEAQIISPEVYSKQDQNKFVAVLPERDENGNAFLPVYYKSRIYIDLSSSSAYGENLEQLLRWIFDKPLHVKPPIGKMPAFLAETGLPSLQTTTQFRRTVDAIRQNKEHANGALNEYFEIFSQNLEHFRISKKEGHFDDQVVKNIEEFLPYRNETIETFLSLSRYRQTQETWETVHRFFEKLIPYLDKPENVSQWTEWDFDNFKFIIHELFLYAVACLLKHECFQGVAYLLRQHYYLDQNSRQGRDPMVPFTVFWQHLQSIERRNKRLKLNRISLHADFLEQRSKFSGLPFKQILQADFLLFLRDSLDCLRADRYQNWYPLTLVYAERHYGPFEMFARSQSSQYFEKVKRSLDITKKDDLQALWNAYKEGKLNIPKGDWSSLCDPINLTGFDNLATLP
jgi:hypothetical protein